MSVARPVRAYFNPGNFASDIAKAVPDLRSYFAGHDFTDPNEADAHTLLRNSLPRLGHGCYKVAFLYSERLVIKVGPRRVLNDEYQAWLKIQSTPLAQYAIPTLYFEAIRSRDENYYDAWTLMPRLRVDEWACEDGYSCSFEHIAENVLQTNDWSVNHVHLADTAAMFDYQFGFAF